jgi:carbon starvation protein
MNGLVLIVIVIVAFLVAYTTYGSWLTKKWGIDPKRETPACTERDDVDYVPSKAPVVFGHHFASIAGAGPILGPIQAAIFGWIPVLLWIVIGSIFFGGVHDMGSLFSSIRHKGKSIGEVIGKNMGNTAKKLFGIFAWLTLVLVLASFTNVVADTFVAVPEAASASIMLIFLAIIFGFAVSRRGVGLGISSIIGVALLLIIVWLGTVFPLSLSEEIWIYILLAYIFIASVTPVWILLQPRDYLNSFLLYAAIIGGILGIVIQRPTIELAGVTSFKVGNQYLFPMLFVMIACGAISGFHSLVASGTSSKQLNSEKDIKLVGYGAMLVEGGLATIAMITAAYIGADKLHELLGSGGPINVFANGLGNFIAGIGIPFTVGRTFASLAISAFALTSLDTATRLARFIFQEFFDFSKEGEKPKENILTNRYFATGVTVIAASVLAFKGWERIWPLFGSANQLLAAIALLSLAVWLKRSGREFRMTIIPVVFMFAVTLTALLFLMSANLSNLILLILAGVLFVLALALIWIAYKSLSSMPSDKLGKIV